MPLKTTPLDELPALNLTSMIDVLFLLIIFFMVGTKFIELEHQVELKVPQISDKGALTAPPDKKVINVYRDGSVTLDHKTVTYEELARQLAASRAQYQRLGVLVRGDAQCTFQHVANALGACRRAGISDLAISVRLAEAEPAHARR